MREFLLLPFAALALIFLIAVAGLAAALLLPFLIYAEGRGLRLGGVNQDRYLEDLGCDPFRRDD
jgi:hypothetical protein